MQLRPLLLSSCVTFTHNSSGNWLKKDFLYLYFCYLLSHISCNVQENVSTYDLNCPPFFHRSSPVILGCCLLHGLVQQYCNWPLFSILTPFFLFQTAVRLMPFKSKSNNFAHFLKMLLCLPSVLRVKSDSAHLILVFTSTFLLLTVPHQGKSFPSPGPLYHPRLFFSFLISWRLITLQYCSGFCHTLT